MGKLSHSKKLLDKGRKPKYVIRQHCMRCNTVLAVELTDKLGARAFSEYWFLDGSMWIKGRWYGNHTKCPCCGLEGKLPGDKPYSAEAIQENDDKELHEKIIKKIEEKRSKANASSNRKIRSDNEES